VELAERRVGPVEDRRMSPVFNYARQVGVRAGPSAVVLGRSKETWPVPAFGPKIVALEHMNPLVPDGKERGHDVNLFFAPGTSEAEREAILQKYGVTHVLASSREAKSFSRFMKDRAASQRLAWGYLLYQLNEP
jgi:hypothetical protein